MRDPRVEVLFRIAMTAYSARNFRPDGVANLNMGIRGDNELMRRFYRALLREGRTPAAALRDAQESLRREPAWEAPFYWAGFVLQGDL